MNTLRTALPEDAELLATLHDRWRRDWPEFGLESPGDVRGAIVDYGMVYLLLGERATVALFPDPTHGYGFLDFPYAHMTDAPTLITAGLKRLTGLRVECPLPAERQWEAQMLLDHGFTPGRRQRRMVLSAWPARGPVALPDGVERAVVSPEEVEALHDLAFPDHGKAAGWRTDPGIFPVLGLRTAQGVAGYALAAQIGDVFWLWELAVHPDWRGQGLGRILTLLALDTLRGAGAQEVHVNVNDDHGQHAPALYESVGFQTAHLSTRYVKQPD